MKTSTKIALGLCAVLTVLIYSFGFDGPFIYDDIRQIQLNDHLHQIWDSKRFLLNGIRQARIVQNLGFALEWTLGGGQPWVFRLVNVLLHVANALLFLRFVARLGFGNGACAIAATLFLLHPIHSASVAYIMGRISLLQSMVYLGAVLAYASHRRTVWPAAICALGALVKESCLLLPLMLFAWDLAIEGEVRWRRLAVCTAASSLGIIVLVFLGLNDQAGVTGLSLYPMAQYIVVQLMYWGLIPVLLLDPTRQSFLHPFHETLDASGWSLVAVGVVVLVVLFGQAIRFRSEPRRAVLAILVLVWLAPTGSLLQMINPFAEYRLYLAAGCMLALGIDVLEKTIPNRWQLVFSLLFGAYCVAFLWQQVQLYRDPIQLYRVAHHQYPESSMITVAYGSYVAKSGDLDHAERLYEQAMEANRGEHRKSGRPAFRSAQLKVRRGAYREAIAVLDTIPVNRVHGRSMVEKYYRLKLQALAGVGEREAFEKTQSQAPNRLKSLTWEMLGGK